MASSRTAYPNGPHIPFATGFDVNHRWTSHSAPELPSEIIATPPHIIEFRQQTLNGKKHAATYFGKNTSPVPLRMLYPAAYESCDFAVLHFCKVPAAQVTAQRHNVWVCILMGGPPHQWILALRLVRASARLLLPGLTRVRIRTPTNGFGPCFTLPDVFEGSPHSNAPI